MIRDIDIVPAIKTDHSAITLQLHKIEDGKKGPGFWKMNSSMLNDTSFIQKMDEHIAVWREEAKKLRIRGYLGTGLSIMFVCSLLNSLKERLKLIGKRRKLCKKNIKMRKLNFNKSYV